MTKPNQIDQLNELSKVCEQLSEVITIEPFEKMEHQLCQQEQQTEKNIAWLDEALSLLSHASEINNEQQAAQVITQIEQFVSNKN